MDKSMFNFELLDKEIPSTVINNYMKQVEEVTQGYVIGNINEYSGNIFSYTKRIKHNNSMSSIAALFPKKENDEKIETIKVDIQTELGELDREEHRYEVFLTVKGLQHYKYRMMFVRYGTLSYPVTIVMNQELAAEYSGKRQDRFLINSMKELEVMMDTVLNSHTMITLIQNLINESLRQELKGNMVITNENESLE